MISIEQAISRLNLINPSSFTSIRSSIDDINVIVKESVEINADPSIILMDVFSESKPEIIALALIKCDMGTEDIKTLLSLSEFIQYKPSVFKLLHSLVYNSTLNHKVSKVDYNVMEMYRDFISFVRFDLIDIKTIHDDITEIICNIYRKNKLCINIRDRILRSIEKYIYDISDNGYFIFKDMYNEIIDLDECVGRYIIYLLVFHLYMNSFILKAKENQNKLMMRFIYKYRILEAMRYE